jgi:putative phosphoribosyl transferase
MNAYFGFPIGEQTLYRDRIDAGARLAKELESYRGERPVVLGIPRGGVPVAAEVARQLGGELDVMVARKLGAPGHEELAIGAVTADGARYLNPEIMQALAVDDRYLAEITARQTAEAAKREARFRGPHGPIDLGGRTVILVDDGLATGATMRAAARAVRARSPARLIIAVPVGSREAVAALEEDADRVVCPEQPEPFIAIGLHYADFGQVDDAEVLDLLRRMRG